jgi:Flp pilus assembly pilin Flp
VDTHVTLKAAAGPHQENGRGQLRTYLADEQGQGMTEYALIIAVIALALLLTQVFFAQNIKDFFSNIGNMLT